LFLTVGMDVNATGTNGFSALSLAAVTGNTNLVNLLLARGADINYAGQ